MVIGTPLGERRKDFAWDFVCSAIVTLIGFRVSAPQMCLAKAVGVTCLISFIIAFSLVVKNQFSRMSYFSGIGYSYPRIWWEYFFGRKPFGDKKNHNGEVEPLQF